MSRPKVTRARKPTFKWRAYAIAQLEHLRAGYCQLQCAGRDGRGRKRHTLRCEQAQEAINVLAGPHDA